MEHFPPSRFFPERGSGISTLLSVPSCSEHNSGKSARDEYLRFVLAATTNRLDREILDRASRGIARLANRGSKNLAKFGLQLSNDESSDYVTDGTAPVDQRAIVDALSAVARATYYYNSQLSKKLPSPLKVFPIFLGIDPDCSDERQKQLAYIEACSLQDLSELPICGTNKDVFAYQVIEGDDIIIVNMIFYDQKLACVIAEK